MKTFEINGNLKSEMGLGSRYPDFRRVIYSVRNFFIQYLEEEFMNSIDLYVDNATSNSGYTPKITPILGKYLIIKLGINPTDGEARIAFQFAHELMHFVYYAKHGIDKQMADEQEEVICSAAALIIVHNFYPEFFEQCNNYVKSLKRPEYRKGAEVAEMVAYHLGELIKKI